MSFSARDRWVLTATILGSSMVFIDGAVIALALPSLQRAYNADASGLAWIVESYALVLGSLMLFGGAIGDRIGLRRTFAIGTILFTVSSIGCACASSLDMMIAMRVIQGFGGALLAPASLALLGDHFDGAGRGRAIAAWSAFGALSSSIGPALGGLLIDHLGWRSVFWINVPIAAVVVFAIWRHIGESKVDREGRLDISGALLCTLGFGALTYALIGKSVPIAIAGVAILGIFIAVERAVPKPLLPLRMFASTTFSGVNVATLFLYGALGANFYVMPLAMIQGHGYSATAAAVSTLPLVAGLMLLSRYGTALATRIGRRTVLTIGPALAGCGFAAIGLLQAAHPYWSGFLPGLLVMGVGMGITVAPLTTTVINSAHGHVGTASGVNNAISRIAGLLAIAAFTILVSWAFNTSLDHLLAGTHLPTAQQAALNAQRARLGGAQLADAHARELVARAFLNAYSAVCYGCALLGVLASLTSALLIRQEPAAEQSATQA